MSQKYIPPKDGKFQVIDEGRNVVKEYCRVLSKKIPKSGRWLGAYKCVDEINDFKRCLYTANNIKVTTESESESRRNYQTLAVAHLKTAASMIDELFDDLGLDHDDLKHFADLANHELVLLSGWMSKEKI